MNMPSRIRNRVPNSIYRLLPDLLLFVCLFTHTARRWMPNDRDRCNERVLRWVIA